MRREFSAKVKLAAWDRANGHCEIVECGAVLRPGRFTFDHVNPDYFGGEPTLANCQVICRECDRTKTYQADAPAIAKSKRIRKREAGIRKPRTITRWRRFNDEIVIKPRER